MGRKKRIQNYHPKFFPFSSGIPWSVESGKYIIPKIDIETWRQAIEGKNIIIAIPEGNLIEAFFSLCAIESISSICTDNKIFWIGKSKYSFFPYCQGLSKESNIKLTKKQIEQYPVPLFFDKNNNVYFNLLCNYLIRYSWWKKYPQEINSPIFEQMYNNVMLPWNKEFPILRKLDSIVYDDMVKTNRLKEKTKIVTIILNKTDEDVLGWNLSNIKEFSQLMYNKGIRVIVFTKNSSVFYGTKILVCDYDLRKILQILKRSWMVLSTDIDWLLISLLVSKAKIISRHVDGPKNLFANAEFLGVGNDIFTDKDLISPSNVFFLSEE